MVGSGSPYPQEDNKGGNEAVFQLKLDHGEQGSLNEGRNLRGNSGRATDGRAGHRADNLDEQVCRNGTCGAVVSEGAGGERPQRVRPRRTSRACRRTATLQPSVERWYRPAELKHRLVARPAFQVAEHQGSSVMLGEPAQLFVQRFPNFVPGEWFRLIWSGDVIRSGQGSSRTTGDLGS